MMIESIPTLLKDKKFPPVLFLFGEEEFLLEEAYDKIFRSIMNIGVSEFDVEIVDGEEVSADNIAAMAAAFPMMSERRLVVVKHFDRAVGGRRSKSAEKSQLASYLRNPSPSTILILLNTTGSTANEELKNISQVNGSGKQAERAKAKLKKLKFPFNLLIEHSGWIEFPRLYDRSIIAWIGKRFSSASRTISPEASEFMLARTGTSLRDIANEIEKILTYVGDKKEITLDDVLALVGDSREYNVFELQKAVGERSIARALNILHHLLAADRAEILIVTTLTRYILELWKLIDIARGNSNVLEISRLSGVPSYFVPEYLGVLNRYSSADLERGILALRDADRKLKSSGEDGLSILQTLLLRIMGSET